MSWEIIIFFIAGPLIIGVGNLILGPIFNKKVPFKIQIRSFIVGSVIYLILTSFVYYFLLQGRI